MLSKLPTAPESKRAVVAIAASVTRSLTGKFMLDAEVVMLVVTLTGLVLDDGRNVQEIFRCPA